MPFPALALALAGQVVMTAARAPVYRSPEEGASPVAFLTPGSRISIRAAVDYPFLPFVSRGELSYVHRDDVELATEGVAAEERFWAAAILGDGDGLRRAVAVHGVDVDASNAEGWTSLMLASASGHHEEARLLLTLGANPAAANDSGDTALIVASRTGRLEMVRLLASAPGADLDAPDANGWTAYTWALSKGNEEIRAELIGLGAREVAVPEQELEGRRMSGSIVPPLLQSKTACEYSMEGVAERVEGTVVLEVVIGTDGRITDTRVLEGLPHGLDAQAIECVQQWRFAPGTLRGEPVRVIAEIAVLFEL